MRAGHGAGTDAASWYVEADRVGAAPGVKRRSRAGLDEARATSARAVAAASLFLAFLAAALLFGGHAAIGPLLRAAIAAREASGRGDVVYTMPDGIFCRHVSFDNATAEITESTVERCPNDIGRGRKYNAPSFVWGAN
jgi:hypothetical protein